MKFLLLMACALAFAFTAYGEVYLKEKFDGKCIFWKIFINLHIYGNLVFLDGDAWKSRWIQSKHKSDYGEWKVTAGKFYGDADEDKGT